MKMKIELESQEERELFERMKAKCSICGGTDCTHQVQFMSISMDDYLKLSDELALARVLVRELGDRLSKLEKAEPVGKFAKFTDGIWREVTDGSAGVPLYTTPQQRTWVGLTDEEQQQAYEQWQNDGWGVFYNAIEAKLKEKNNG